MISVSGADCDEEEVGLEAWFALVAYDPEHGVSFTVIDESTATPEDGDWSGELTVPEGADPDIDHFVAAECTFDFGEGSVGQYDPVPFDVTAGDPTSPTTAPEVPETPETPATVAPVATPVVAQPSFTG